MMGAGIAYVSANNGIDVILIDQSQEAANKGIESINQLLNDGIKRGKITTAKKDEIINRIIPTDDYSMLAGSDLVVEAGFEDTKVKELATKRAQQYIDDKTIFATNIDHQRGETLHFAIFADRQPLDIVDQHVCRGGRGQSERESGSEEFE